MEEARGYFEFLAKLGLTKHMGSLEATRQVIELAHLRSGQLVLDVGTGVGATPVHLARELGCRVVAVDLLEGMVEQARERAGVAGVADQIQFAAADARQLPFADGAFDAVIMESVNVFFQDKQGAMRNYARVVKPGGSVSITEMTWLNPPSPEQADYYKRTVYADALQKGEWMALLEGAGLQDVVGRARAVDIPREGRQRIQRYGCRGFLRVLVNTVRTIVKDRASRDFLASVTRSLPGDMVSDVGYGVYAGRKPR